MLASKYGVSPASLLSLRPTLRWVSRDFSDIPETPSPKLILSGAVLKTPEELANFVSLLASSAGWMDRVRLRAERCWYERLYQGPNHDIWIRARRP
jgi:hypothetical protein